MHGSRARSSWRGRDALNAIRLACEFVQGMDYTTFLMDVKTQSAVIRQPEVLGEACGHVSAVLRAAHADVPWAKAVGMRNNLIPECLASISG